MKDMQARYNNLPEENRADALYYLFAEWQGLKREDKQQEEGMTVQTVAEWLESRTGERLDEDGCDLAKAIEQGPGEHFFDTDVDVKAEVKARAWEVLVDGELKEGSMVYSNMSEHVSAIWETAEKVWGLANRAYIHQFITRLFAMMTHEALSQARNERQMAIIYLAT